MPDSPPCETRARRSAAGIGLVRQLGIRHNPASVAFEGRFARSCSSMILAAARSRPPWERLRPYRIVHQLCTKYAILLTNKERSPTLLGMEVDVQKLKRLREDKVLSQRELARMANLAYGTVWRIENGHPEARTSTIRKIAGALGVEPRELILRQEGR